ncbi:MAG: hypothetical protein OHK0056_22210 [Bacteriovoracaceae bacterium]
MKMYFMTMFATLSLLTAGLVYADTVEGQLTMGKILGSEIKGATTEVAISIDLPVCHARLTDEIQLHVNYEDEKAYINVSGQFEFENKEIYCFHNGSKLLKVNLDRAVAPKNIYLGFDK